MKDDDTPPIVVDNETKALEVKVVEFMLDVFLADGFSVSVTDEEQTQLSRSHSKAQILKKLWACDIEYLVFAKNNIRGVVTLVHGNDGWDVISDHHMNLMPWMEKVDKFVDELSGQG